MLFRSLRDYVEMPTAEQKMTNLTNKTQGKSSRESTFSLDEFVSSVSLGDWVALVLSICLLGGLLLYWLKTTVSGKMLDSAAGSGIKLLQSFVDELNEKVTHADPQSPEWRIWNEMKNRRMKELEDVRTSRPRRN